MCNDKDTSDSIAPKALFEDAIVSDMQYCPIRTLLHMQSCPELCKNRPVDMYMTVHDCMCARKEAIVHALNLRICSMNIHVLHD